MTKFVYILFVVVIGYAVFSYTMVKKQNEKLHTKIIQLKAVIQAKNTEIELCNIYNSIINTGIEDAENEDDNGTITFDPNKL